MIIGANVYPSVSEKSLTKRRTDDLESAFVRWSILLPLLVACAPAAAPPSPAAPAPTSSAANAKPRAPVVVAFVVDQFAGWVAEERLPLLPDTGGFARLRREGSWYTTVRLPYACTDTAPGHAALHSGKVPAESGIWGNEVPAKGGGRVTFLRDEATRMITPTGVTDQAGASAARLKVDNVGDRLRRASPNALHISVSMKDRGAIMPGGHHPTHALWFDKGLGTFVTSTAFEASYPSWAVIGDAAHVNAARSAPWTLSDRAWIEKNVKVPDDAPGEGNLDGFGVTFPHVAKTSAAFRASPASDTMVLDLALAGVAAEYRPDRPTLITLSMSASDIIGHVFGPDSWEAWDHLYKLDASIGRFLTALEAKVGGPVDVILSADHGVSSMPETIKALRPASCDGPNPPTDRWNRPLCVVGIRTDEDVIGRELKEEAKKTLGAGDFFAGVSDPYVFLTAEARALEPPKRRLVDDVVQRVFERHKAAFTDAIDVGMLVQKCPSILKEGKDEKLTLVCRSYMPDSGAGDYYMVARTGFIFDNDIVPGHGASHGGPFLYDRTIPLLVRGAGIKPGVVVREETPFTLYAEMLAGFLRLQ